jgi:hypothetical protein
VSAGVPPFVVGLVVEVWRCPGGLAAGGRESGLWTGVGWRLDWSGQVGEETLAFIYNINLDAHVRCGFQVPGMDSSFCYPF